MDEMEFENLAALMLGGSQEKADKIIEEYQLDELLMEKYGLDFNTWMRISADLLPFTPKVQTAIAKNVVHAFVHEDEHGPCTIVKMDAE
jgi:hypothetical protein